MKPPKKSTKNTKLTKSKLRIIGGDWRSRTLPIPDIEGLRPTPDRVRETLFNWLSVWIPGAHCGDFFCGSGALGLEALSRGASSCLFADTSRIVTQQMTANLATLGATNANVIQQSAVDLLKTPPVRPLDIIFLDPPFRQGWLAKLMPLLNDNWLANRAWVYIEMEKESPLPELPTFWSLKKEKMAGQLCYRLFEVNKPV
ncbi:16S rRNA (guanine(966)-N(2))-methyltransferase RsmD [Marinomonas sp. 15G1-11]|uniref:Ribosomal RNA small subunit methyltransferase D n=1 Tax=Marinomonas phaeophyticola TaxID=3004091 RepID=A0ABT4JW70_9GAMM|nr:16S rRNA (guanine(966)-N(2))-methyltransferase RsmD [Marinomonas sp. 15G1-11]MCZ2722043.1 16S rRNA (guanine(966)-N(2))-methyltransferase RsmD [Marinomonas sp. 15G1-11]